MSRLGCKVVFLVGRAPEPAQSFAADVKVVEGLDYGGSTPANAADLADRMEAAAVEALGSPPDLWHAHNHSLGKNTGYPVALRHLADRSHRLLLQMHDFAEDGRPTNFHRQFEDLESDTGAFGRACYPLADHVHYAVLNRRDHAHLVAAGIGEHQCHLLPNAVDLQGSDETVPVDPDLFLYPTRAIRRKNIGELLFWSAMAEPGQRFATTLAPNNPLEKPRYERWVQFAEAQQLPAQFEAGTFADTSFTALLRSACAMVTTSVAEGFGLAFLEPGLVGRPLVGRNLPAITQDFVDNDIPMGNLYERLEIPLEWVGAEAVRDRIASALAQSYRAYDRPCTDADTDLAYNAAVREGRVDFGHLDETAQEAAIERVCSDPAAKSEVTPQQLCPPGFDDPDPIKHHRKVVGDCYSLEDYGRRLQVAYDAVGEASPMDDDAHIGTRLLDAFLAPKHFLLLRT